MFQLQTNRDLNLIRLEWHPTGQTIRLPTETAEASGVNPNVPESLIQVSESGIFVLWVLIQGIDRNLCWHLMVAFLQIIRIILMKRISQIILVCNVIIISEGWSKILGVRGMIALTMTSVCKLCIDVSVKILGKDDFVLWCEMTIISIDAIYLMGIPMFRYRRVCG